MLILNRKFSINIAKQICLGTLKIVWVAVEWIIDRPLSYLKQSIFIANSKEATNFMPFEHVKHFAVIRATVGG